MQVCPIAQARLAPSFEVCRFSLLVQGFPVRSLTRYQPGVRIRRPLELMWQPIRVKGRAKSPFVSTVLWSDSQQRFSAPTLGFFLTDKNHLSPVLGMRTQVIAHIQVEP